MMGKVTGQKGEMYTLEEAINKRKEREKGDRDTS